MPKSWRHSDIKDENMAQRRTREEKTPPVEASPPEAFIQFGPTEPTIVRPADGVDAIRVGEPYGSGPQEQAPPVEATPAETVHEQEQPVYRVVGYCAKCHQPIAVVQNALQLTEVNRHAASILTACTDVVVGLDPKRVGALPIL
jgi:hypothetical protein